MFGKLFKKAAVFLGKVILQEIHKEIDKKRAEGDHEGAEKLAFLTADRKNEGVQGTGTGRSVNR